jgi:hypothetical protein
MESSDKFLITFKYNHPDHELVITSLLSDLADFLQDDFELYIYQNSMILLFKNLYWIYEIHHKLNIIKQQAVSFNSIKIIDGYIQVLETLPEFKLKVKQGFYVTKLKLVDSFYKSF